ncbi:LOW QUALITY PROTEIN: alpha-1,3-mannosyl-glycoprotein 4-beta-N-acetylglucosaminyltransferase-like protein MGAT4E [Nannospalax galili]|uniref:LOW QUALITY PROTEIN: alpha-1,3-mannosyl-glycoprotein 4-beta-N-acetylglucosaminyltransferase-like protein MGAT4E n=1 Tax=Nannospalax galili TaxID=1026970 RepID=UPI0004ED6D6F|nr:LOW QUALITY PROTEIN: alpha-1,3-mannosyl-glycoprotein 4-beta-N-acetylglucosaminyltransferase-like protein MGAT4E [Nannospalax galili]
MVQYFIRRYFKISVVIVFLWLFITLKIPEETEYGQNLVTIIGKLGGNVKDRQIAKAWLTVGITSRQDRRGLLDTLASLYHASSASEKEQIIVLVHLADSDFIWLKKTVAHISSLYSSQILAGQLLLIHAPFGAYLTVNGVQNETYTGQFYSKQNIDHAFLMSFATKLSTYFLLIEDNVFCAPSFVTDIHSKVTTMKSNTWVLLEISNMGILGKLFHSRDLPLLTHFLLLFHKERPLDKLILHFRTLLAQQNSILCRPFLFYHKLSHSTSNNKTKITQEKIPYGPDTLPGAVFTNMEVSDVHVPWEANSLNDLFFWTYNVNSENHLTVILNCPANVRRVQVRTGSVAEGKYILAKGQVELGYKPEGMPQNCTRFTLLGYLMQGQMDQEIILKSMRYQVSCIKLVVNAKQTGGLMIRNIYLWKEKKVDQS